ncbi:Sialin [Labeo rohita]|uniref:Sialin n=1 Tax=Labeo rohita TaxID=84645 RepID=A0ABQ8L3X7_LABRO|nr:Sialin [Labeo rohita]
MSGRPAQGLWSSRHLSWHINCLEMLPIFRALKYFLPDLRDRHVLVCTDNTAVDKLLSLQAVHIPGHLNVGADVLSRQGPRPGEWMVHPEVVKQIWKVFGPPQVDSFATRENAQCPLWYSLAHPAPLGLDAMVQTWPRLCLYAFPPIALLPEVLKRIRRDRLSMGDSRQEGSPLTGGGYHPAPPPRAVEAVGVASEGAQLSTGLSHSTLKVYVAAISAYHAPLGGMSVGKDPLVVRFLHGVLRLRPLVRPHVPTWDLAVVLEALCRPPFEPIEEISVQFLTIKTALLLALTFLKRGGDLQALSVAPSYVGFAPGMTKAFLYPKPGYVPKVATTSPQPVVLQAICPPPFREPDQQKLKCMCPVRALDAYVHRAALWHNWTNCSCVTVPLRRVETLRLDPSFRHPCRVLASFSEADAGRVAQAFMLPGR